MRFRLVETYNIGIDVVNYARKIINSYIKTKSSRGNGVLCEFICSAINLRYGTSLDYSDYYVHHINGIHTDNDVTNIALVRLGGGVSHNAVHINAIKSAISKCVYNVYGYTNNHKITISDINGIPATDLLYQYVITITKVTMRNSLKLTSGDIIIVDNYI